MQALTIVVVALCFAQSFADMPPCDPAMIDIITQYWDENGVPTKVMESLARNGKGVLLYSTEVVPVKVSVEDPLCVKGVFTKTTAKFSVVPSEGSLDAAESTVSYKVKEVNGVIHEDRGRIHKYIISNDGGVTCFYTCNPKKKPDEDATPAAGLAVALKKYKSAKKAIADAKSTMEDLGFDLQTSYREACT